jgi:hypothetical protein
MKINMPCLFKEIQHFGEFFGDTVFVLYWNIYLYLLTGFNN